MALIGGGMLAVLTDVDTDVEQEFNRWYDREHVAERVKLPGFLNARRYRARRGERRYLALYETASLDDLGSPAYVAALRKQSAWSVRMLARMRRPMRFCAEITASYGHGRGGGLALIRVTKPADPGRVMGFRLHVAQRLRQIAAIDGVLAAHLLESDPALSTPLPGGEPGPGDEWLLLIEGSDDLRMANAIGEELAGQDLVNYGAQRAERPGFYRLAMDLHRDEAAEVDLDRA